MPSEMEMLQQSLRNRSRAYNDFDQGPCSDGQFSELSREDLVETIDLFRKRVQVVELENVKLKIENLKLREKAVEDSWRLNPDRSGGQFSQDEIDRANNGGW